MFSFKIINSIVAATDDNSINPLHFSLYSEAYEKLLEFELSEAVILPNSEQSPCDFEFFPKSSNKASVLFISMEHSKDFTTWLALAKCLHVWDLDARGYHRGLWRLHFNQIPLYIIGAPFSPYSWVIEIIYNNSVIVTIECLK